MKQDKALPISVIALRADDYSPDGKNVIISLTTKYSTAERRYSVPVECFYDLIVDLRRLNAAASATSIETAIQPAVAPKPAEDLNRHSPNELWNGVGEADGGVPGKP
jgi:hypothetical protein